VHDDDACTCTQNSVRRGGGQRAIEKKLKKIISEVVCSAKSLVENHILACINMFMQICMHVCQEKSPTTKLFSEVRDWKTSSPSPLFT